MTGTRQRHRLRALALGLALRRPRVHPPRPVLVVAVADDERERRAERPALPEPSEHLDLVRLDLLARRAAVALLAAAQVGVDRRPVEHEARREPGEDRHERRPVRLACRRQLERHEDKPKAARIAATGAAVPVHRSKLAAPWRTSASRPSTTSQPAARAAATRAVSPAPAEYASSTTVCPGWGWTSKVVADRRGVDDQVAAGRVRRPLAAARELPHLAVEPREQRRRGAARTDQADARRVDPGDDLLVRVEAGDPPVGEHERVDAVAVGLVAELGRRLLVRDGHVRAGETRGCEPAHRRVEPIRRHVDGDVRPVEPRRRECGVLHQRRQRVCDGMPEQRDEPRRGGEVCHRREAFATKLRLLRDSRARTVTRRGALATDMSVSSITDAASSRAPPRSSGTPGSCP